jgi:hypothetical protein
VREREMRKDIHVGPILTRASSEEGRERYLSAVAHVLYRQSDEYDPDMPNLWQRSGMTSSRWRERAAEFVADVRAASSEEGDEA